MKSFWRSGKDYDIESESSLLKHLGEPFLTDYLQTDNLNPRKPIIVDFGCWSGRHLQLLERVAQAYNKSENAKKRVIGIDEPFAKERIEQARRVYRGFAIYDDGVSRTGLPSSSVDAAISWRVLHNLIEPGEWTSVISEIRRVMKHGAPLVVAVRATHSWMEQKSPMPLKYRTFSYGMDRDDLYFSEAACYATFKFYGFSIPYEIERFAEEEVIDGVRVKNDYWMVPLVVDKRGEALTAKVDEVPYSTPEPSKYLKRPIKKLAVAYS